MKVLFVGVILICRLLPMPSLSNRQLIALVISINVVIIALILSGLLVRFIVNGDEHKENMVTDQQLWNRPFGVFCDSHIISAQLDKPLQTLVNSPPLFDAYALTASEFSNLSKAVVMRDFTLHSLSGLLPNTKKYHNFFFIEGSRIAATACYTRVDDYGIIDDNSIDNTSHVYMYLMKSERVFDYMKERLHTGSCHDLAKDDCYVITLTASKTCEEIDAVNATLLVNNTKTDHYIFVYYYQNSKTDQSPQSLSISLWLTYVVQRQMYDVNRFSRPLAKKVSKLINVRSKIILLDFPWLLDEPYSELYNIEVTLASEPNNGIYLAVFGGIGIVCIVICLLGFVLYSRFHHRLFGYEQL